MFGKASIFLTAALAAVASGAAQFSGKNHRVTDLSITKVLGGNVTLAFTVYDPDPLAQQTQKCGGTWVTGSKGYPTGPYEPCGGTTNFAWNFGSFTSIEVFQLEISHIFKDPSIGDPPYDEVTTFSAANLTSANHPCRTKNGKTVCAQQPDTVIKAPIWGTSA